jgi:hypothetical protein
MVLHDDYIEALNNCIERLASGEDIDAIMVDYPAMANELRPMLEAGNLFSRAAYPLAEVTAAQSRLEPAIRQAAQSSFGTSITGYWPLLAIVLVVGIVGIIWQMNSTASIAIENVSLTTDATEAISASESVEAIVEATAEVTENPTLITIEGEVTAINANTITIYDMDIVLEPSDPILSVIQIGDNLRVEGEYQAGDTLILVAIQIIFIDIDVTVSGGEIWRDSGNCNNPPPPWATANGWRRRCEGSGGRSNGNGNGRGASGGS